MQAFSYTAGDACGSQVIQAIRCYNPAQQPNGSITTFLDIPLTLIR